jgi:hypothetical protein
VVGTTKCERTCVEGGVRTSDVTPCYRVVRVLLGQCKRDEHVSSRHTIVRDVAESVGSCPPSIIKVFDVLDVHTSIFYLYK